MKHHDFIDEVLYNISSLVHHQIPYIDSAPYYRAYTSYLHGESYNMIYSYGICNNESVLISNGIDSLLMTFPSRIAIWSGTDSEFIHIELSKDGKIERDFNIPINIDVDEFMEHALKRDVFITFSQYKKITEYLYPYFIKKVENRNSPFYVVYFGIVSSIRTVLSFVPRTLRGK